MRPGDKANFNNLQLPRTVYWCVVWVQGGACWLPHTTPPHHTPTPQCRQEAGHPSASQCPAWTSGNQTVKSSTKNLHCFLHSYCNWGRCHLETNGWWALIGKLFSQRIYYTVATWCHSITKFTSILIRHPILRYMSCTCTFVHVRTCVYVCYLFNMLVLF